MIHLGITGVPDDQAWADVIELFPWQHNTVYVQATLESPAAQYRSIWYRSTDGGRHWTAVAMPVSPGQDLTSMTISPRPPYWAYALTGDGNAYVSTDGLQWETLWSEPLRPNHYARGLLIAPLANAASNSTDGR